MTTDRTPATRRVGEPSPQTHPDQFTDDEIRAEIRHLARLQRLFGQHDLRALAIVKLLNELARRSNA